MNLRRCCDAAWDGCQSALNLSPCATWRELLTDERHLEQHGTAPIPHRRELESIASDQLPL